MIKTFVIAATASAALASTAAADAFAYNEAEVTGSTVELGQVRADAPGVISLYDYHLGEQGALLGTQEVSAGANYDVRINLGTPPVNDVVAVLTIDGQVVDTKDFDIER